MDTFATIYLFDLIYNRHNLSGLEEDSLLLGSCIQQIFADWENKRVREISPLETAVMQLIDANVQTHVACPDEIALNAFFETHDCSFLADKARIIVGGGRYNVVELLEDVTPAVLISIFCHPENGADYFKRELVEMGFSATDARKLFIALRNIRDGIY